MKRSMVISCGVFLLLTFCLGNISQGASIVYTDMTNQGQSQVLHVSGTDRFGWGYDLVGLVNPSEDWVFSADWRQTFNDADLMVECYSVFVDYGTYINRTGGSYIFRDGQYHNLRMEMSHANGRVDMYVDNSFVGSQVPFTDGWPHYGMNSDYYILFYWANWSQSGSFYVDNVSFASSSINLHLDFEDGSLPDAHGWVAFENHAPPYGGGGGGEPVPEPATMLLVGSGIAGLVAFRRRFRKS
jgi:hypothetical protein